jgi:hypothetical protein
VHKFRIVTGEREKKKSECRWYIHPILHELLLGVGGGGNNGATVSRTQDDSINTILQWQCDVESILRVLNIEFGILQSVVQLATCWTVRGSNLQNVKSGSEIHSTSYLTGTGFSTSGEATRV